FYTVVGLACFFGVMLILPIGAADMPVVIALLNSYGGLTDAAMGFMLDNKIQIITGSLDGSSGFILSILMCRAMNRSITNVLFGEANVPYDELYDMDQINSQFAETDAVVVVGANDVVNPAAKRMRGSPIYGMPILEVERARVVIVCKRSLAAGFAGIDNELYYGEKTLMLFGDAKDTMIKLTAALKS